jgi:hypothetical protein
MVKRPVFNHLSTSFQPHYFYSFFQPSSEFIMVTAVAVFGGLQQAADLIKQFDWSKVQNNLLSNLLSATLTPAEDECPR